MNQLTSSSWSDVLHDDHFQVLLEWAKPKSTPRSPPVAFLYGPPGVGKTTLAHRVFTAAGLKPVECNASQFRNRAAMEELIIPLLHSNNVGDYFLEESHRAIGVILDEIDGLSSGIKGCFADLLAVLKEYKGDNAIICISNEWTDKHYEKLMREALCCKISPPDIASCALWLERPAHEISPLWERHRGDLRKLLQWEDGVNADSNEIMRSFTVKDLVLQILSNNFDIQEDLQLDNNDLNLAGLHLHETLPSWIRVHYGTDKHAWEIYRDCLHSIAISDRQDYYTFFHQHWSLFPLSFQSKLQAVNHRLFIAESPKEIIPPGPTTWDFQYTAVLSQQSRLYNQFKYLCEARNYLETKEIPALQSGGLEMALWIIGTKQSFLFADAPKERAARWDKMLSVPSVPPCPKGSLHSSKHKVKH